MSSAVFALDPAEGYWISLDEKTNRPNGSWFIYQERGKLLGTMAALVGSPQDTKATFCKESYRNYPLQGNVKEMPLVGSPWIFGLAKEKDGEWRNGNIIDVRNGNMFSCDVTFHAADGGRYPKETLEVRGRLGPFGESRFWVRATEREAKSLR